MQTAEPKDAHEPRQAVHPTTLAAALAAATLFTSTGALAREATPDTWLQQATSLMTRTQVSAELAQARASGLTRSWSAGYIEPLRHGRLRATVKAQTLQAIASGEAAAVNAEVYSFTPRQPRVLAQR